MRASHRRRDRSSHPCVELVRSVYFVNRLFRMTLAIILDVTSVSLLHRVNDNDGATIKSYLVSTGVISFLISFMVRMEHPEIYSGCLPTCNRNKSDEHSPFLVIPSRRFDVILTFSCRWYAIPSDDEFGQACVVE